MSKQKDHIKGLIACAVFIVVLFTLAVLLIDYCFACPATADGVFVQCYKFCRAPL